MCEGELTAGVDLPPVLPARMLNEFIYCPRLFYLEWVQGEWADSSDTLEGARVHRRVDREEGTLPSPSRETGKAFETRSVHLSAPGEGLSARIDLLESDGRAVTPVDYKKGRPPKEGGAWDSDEVQIGVQALILREAGYTCDEGICYYAATKTRVRVPIDDELVLRTREAAREARRVASTGRMPAPLVDSPKCPRCSLVGICLPDEVRAFTEPLPPAPRTVRQLVPARDDAQPIYVQAPGARVGKDGDRLSIRERDGTTAHVRLIDVSQLAILGNVTVTSSAISALLDRGTPISHFTFGGWFKGVTRALGNRNAELRLQQYAAAIDPPTALRYARGLVERKIRNSRTLLRRNHVDPPNQVLDELSRLAERVPSADSLEGLLGLEGLAAKAYFSAFPGMIKSDDARSAFNFTTRNRRPPTDPVNALLSLAYSILAKDWTATLLAVGLDPFIGLFHRPRFGRPSLALDLMEEFRPLIGDSVVLQLVNNGELESRHFVTRGNAVNLTADGRKKFFHAYERRMNHEITHPLFGYRISYRRLIEVQARLLARALAGEIDGYPGFCTR